MGWLAYWEEEFGSYGRGTDGKRVPCMDGLLDYHWDYDLEFGAGIPALL